MERDGDTNEEYQSCSGEFVDDQPLDILQITIYQPPLGIKGHSLILGTHYTLLLPLEQERKELFEDYLDIQKKMDDSSEILKSGTEILGSVATGTAATCYLITQNQTFKKDVNALVYCKILGFAFMVGVGFPLLLVCSRLKKFSWSIEHWEDQRLHFNKKVNSLIRRIHETVIGENDITLYCRADRFENLEMEIASGGVFSRMAVFVLTGILLLIIEFLIPLFAYNHLLLWKLICGGD